MTAKEKAIQLVEKHSSKMPPMSDCESIGYPSFNQAKLMALITVEEMKQHSAKLNWDKSLLYDPFLEEVKVEIELLKMV